MDKIDFLPERIRAHRAKRKRLVRQACLLTVCAGGLLLLAHVRQGQVRTAAAEMDVLDARAENLRQQLETRKELERQQAELTVVRRIEEDLGSRINILDVLAELQRVAPEGILLTNLSVETMEVRQEIQRASVSGRRAKSAGSPAKNEEAVVKRVRLMITGLSPADVEVANFIGQLSSSPLFEDVNMGYARNVSFRGRQAREFQTSCYIAR